MAISGETIDYGPCAFMESYSAGAVFSSIDHGGRYAYSNQPTIACWNLARFAETLLPLCDDPDQAVAEATDVINGFPAQCEGEWLAGVRRKLGLVADGDDETDRQLAQDWLDLLEEQAVDFTLAWRRLADAAEGSSHSLESLFSSADAATPWLQRWQSRLGSQPAVETAAAMRRVNPIYIPRNHIVEEALTAATDDNDLALFEQLLEVIARPYDEQPGLEHFAEPAPHEFTECYQTFCGT